MTRAEYAFIISYIGVFIFITLYFLIKQIIITQKTKNAVC